MFNRKQQEIDKLNARCVELARTVKEKSEELRIQKNNNYKIMKVNEKIEKEKLELKNTLRRINQLMTSNQYNNSKALKSKIIELSDVTGNLNR